MSAKTLEQLARREWLDTSTDRHFGCCHVCDLFLFVTKHGRRWLCLTCWESEQ